MPDRPRCDHPPAREGPKSHSYASLSVPLLSQDGPMHFSNSKLSLMSVIGTKRTFAANGVMSANDPKRASR